MKKKRCCKHIYGFDEGGFLIDNKKELDECLTEEYFLYCPRCGKNILKKNFKRKVCCF